MDENNFSDFDTARRRFLYEISSLCVTGQAVVNIHDVKGANVSL